VWGYRLDSCGSRQCVTRRKSLVNMVMNPRVLQRRDHVYVVWLRFSTAATIRPIVHLPMWYEYGAGWNDIDRGNLLIRPPELSGNSTISHIVTKQEELAREIMNLALRSIIFLHSSKSSLKCRKIFLHGDDGFTSPPKNCALQILSPLKSFAFIRV
jgi:hypothetical protein